MYLLINTERIMTSLFVAQLYKCARSTFNPENNRTECSLCTGSYGIVDDNKTCAGDLECL